MVRDCLRQTESGLLFKQLHAVKVFDTGDAQRVFWDCICTIVSWSCGQQPSGVFSKQHARTPQNHKDLGSDCCLTCLSPGILDTLRALRPSRQRFPEDDL